MAMTRKGWVASAIADLNARLAMATPFLGPRQCQPRRVVDDKSTLGTDAAASDVVGCRPV